ncbi:MAG: hypothetical protein JRD68_01115 [Deltaproteobacteria bacterium]|nr:hypothetical protein [Deltaproteobacteria bacterium]
MKKYNLFPIIIILAAAFFLGQALAEEDTGRPDAIERTVVISAKEMTRISGSVTIENTTFIVDKNTVIFSPRRMKISLIELMVPCRARITFYPDDAEPVIKEIRVQRHLSGASSAFPPM